MPAFTPMPADSAAEKIPAPPAPARSRRRCTAGLSGASRAFALLLAVSAVVTRSASGGLPPLPQDVCEIDKDFDDYGMFYFCDNQNLTEFPEPGAFPTPNATVDGNHAYVTTLHVGQNSLTELPSSLSHAPGLVMLAHLYLGFNKITAINPGALHNFTRLKSLVVSDNMLSGILDVSTLAPLRILRTLELENNDITGITGSFKDNHFLYMLVLADNKITQLSPGVFDHTFLNFVDLDNNNITALPITLLHNLSLTQVSYVSFEGNPMSCKVAEGTIGMNCTCTDDQAISKVGLMYACGKFKPLPTTTTAPARPTKPGGGPTSAPSPVPVEHAAKTDAMVYVLAVGLCVGFFLVGGCGFVLRGRFFKDKSDSAVYAQVPMGDIDDI